MQQLLKLFSIKFIASLLGLLYSIIQVHYFGASRVIEIYFAAQSLIYLVTSLTQSGQLAEIFLPEYHKLNSLKKGLGYRALNVVINRMVVFGTILIFVMFLIAPWLINIMVPGFSIEDKESASLIFRVLLPVLYLTLMNSFYITVLNAEQQFGRAEFLGLTNTVVNILILIMLYPFIGLWALVISTILGKVIEFVFYIWQLTKKGYRFQLIFNLNEFNHKSFFKSMQTTFLYVGATQFYNIVLTASISFLPEGVYAIFKYVQNLSAKIRGLFVQPFITIFFTQYSVLVQNLKVVGGLFKKTTNAIININGVIIIGSILLGDSIIDLIWGGEKFSKNDVGIAFIFLLFNVFAIFLSSIGTVYRKMAVSHGKAKFLYLYWVIAQIMSAGISYLLITYIGLSGLYFIIPINAFLTGITSYIVYKTTQHSVDFNMLTKNNLLLLSYIIVAAFIKYIVLDTLFLTQTQTVLLSITLVLLLSLYPLSQIYTLLKRENNSN